MIAQDVLLTEYPSTQITCLLKEYITQLYRLRIKVVTLIK